MKNKPVVTLMAFSALFFAMLQPPEAFPNGKLAVLLCATFTFLIALSERKIPQSFLRAGSWIFGLLFLHTFSVSVDLYRSLDTLASIWTYYCLIGFFVYSSEGLETQLAGAVVLLSAVVSGYGLYQYFWGFDKVYSYIFYAGSDQVVKAPALNIIATRRVFSTLALPGTLWGFLVCALPFHAMLWKRGWKTRAAVVVSGAMLLTAGFLTRSFGFLLGLFILALVYGWIRHRNFLWKRVLPVMIGLAAVALLFYAGRRGMIQSQNPVGLRFLNWASAWNIFAERPLGTGLNTFGVVYPEYMMPGANETQYVHNTPLQLLSELGWPLVLALSVALLWGANSIRRFFHAGLDDRRFWLLLALAVWMAHNMVDIDLYFPSVGVLGAVLIGSFFSRRPQEFPRISRLSIAGTSLVALAFVAFAGVSCVASELQARAQIEFENKKLATAIETLDIARYICPINSSIQHDAGEILLNLYHQTKKPEYLTRATTAFETAIRLSPEKSGSRVGYALSLSTANRMTEAREQIRIAQTLYPSSAYVQSIAQLMGQRIQ